jgi:hypothetical protein
LPRISLGNFFGSIVLAEIIPIFGSKQNRLFQLREEAATLGGQLHALTTLDINEPSTLSMVEVAAERMLAVCQEIRKL